MAVPELLSRFDPMMVTPPFTPVRPHGVKNAIVGEHPPGFALMNSLALLAVPLEFATWIVPLASPATVAQSVVPETTLNADTGVPPISTRITTGLEKFVPLIATTHPVGPLVGENEEMLGVAADAGASSPSTSKEAMTATAATREPRYRLESVKAPSTLASSRIPIQGTRPSRACPLNSWRQHVAPTGTFSATGQMSVSDTAYSRSWDRDILQ